MKIKLMYLTETYAEEGESPYGYPEVYGIEQYNGAVCREKIVIRMDLLKGLHKFFSEESLCRYRGAIYRIIAGYIQEEEKLEGLFNELFKQDHTFRVWLGTVYYFSDVLEKMPWYSYLIDSVKEAIKETRDALMKHMGGGATFVAISRGYIYFAAKDTCREIHVPEGYGEEVVSYAANRQCIFKADRQALYHTMVG